MKKFPFEDMKTIYDQWSQFDCTGTHGSIFKSYGWTRVEYFNEVFNRQFLNLYNTPLMRVKK